MPRRVSSYPCPPPSLRAVDCESIGAECGIELTEDAILQAGSAQSGQGTDEGSPDELGNEGSTPAERIEAGLRADCADEFGKCLGIQALCTGIEIKLGHSPLSEGAAYPGPNLPILGEIGIEWSMEVANNIWAKIGVFDGGFGIELNNIFLVEFYVGAVRKDMLKIGLGLKFDFTYCTVRDQASPWPPMRTRVHILRPLGLQCPCPDHGLVHVHARRSASFRSQSAKRTAALRGGASRSASCASSVSCAMAAGGASRAPPRAPCLAVVVGCRPSLMAPGGRGVSCMAATPCKALALRPCKSRALLTTAKWVRRRAPHK